MRNLFLILVLAIALAACASAPAPQSPVPMGGKAATSNGGFFLYGTLTEPGTIEFRLAPLYTRVTRIAHTATRRVRAGRLDVDTDEKIEGKLKAAKSRIDEARIFAGRPDVYDARVRQAMATLDEADQLLQEKSR